MFNNAGVDFWQSYSSFKQGKHIQANTGRASHAALAAALSLTHDQCRKLVFLRYSISPVRLVQHISESLR